MSREASAKDRRMLLILCGVMLVMIVGVSMLAPQSAENDPRPTITNSGPKGAKAAYLTLGALGIKTSHWDGSLAKLNEDWSDAQVERTTLILAAPDYPATEQKALAVEVKRFLERGGRVLATGPSGALLLPDGEVKAPGLLESGLCHTTPEGPGPLARAGSVEMTVSSQWANAGPRYSVEQRCGADAVVVRYNYGRGEAVWWSSPMPLTNAGVRQEASLRLALASIGTSGMGEGARRTVLFDESLHEERETTLGTLRGLPWWSLGLQAAALGLLLVLSRGRGNGPLRLPVRVPRTSPIEFAESMGRLYARAGATEAATEAARRRLAAFLVERCGVPREVLGDAEGIAEALQERLGGDWTAVGAHLAQAQVAATTPTKPGSALRLVQALEADQRMLEERLAVGFGEGGRVHGGGWGGGVQNAGEMGSDKLHEDRLREEVAP